MKLTAKRELYVQGLISGLSQREAYKRAGYSANAVNIDRDASMLFKNPQVFQRYQELLEEHKQKALWTREEAVSDLLWLKARSRESIEEIGVRQANSNALLNTIKELNTLEDLYPKKNAEPENKESEVASALRGLADGIKSYAKTE